MKFCSFREVGSRIVHIIHIFDDDADFMKLTISRIRRKINILTY